MILLIITIVVFIYLFFKFKPKFQSKHLTFVAERFENMIELGEYLSSKNYYGKDEKIWWYESKNFESSSIIRDSHGYYWSVTKDNSLFYLTNEKGDNALFSLKVFTDTLDSKQNEIFVKVSFFLSADSRGDSLPFFEDYIIHHACYENGKDVSENDLEQCKYSLMEERYDYVNSNELNHNYDKIPVFEWFEDNVLFKHGNKLLDSRDLEDKNWFHHYSLSNANERGALSAIDKVNFEEDEDGPYLWWKTQSIPEKNGFIAYQDNRSNSFYVKKGSNLGVCVIYEGQALEDKRVELRLFFDGYFNIKVKL